MRGTGFLCNDKMAVDRKSREKTVGFPCRVYYIGDMGTTKLVRFQEGEALFQEGATGREMYIVRSGTVSVYKDTPGEGRVLIAELGQGAFVGEMSFISGLKRSATAVAAQPVMANCIHTDVLQADAFGLNGWAVSVARVVADRIRRTTDLFVGESQGSGQGVRAAPAAAFSPASREDAPGTESFDLSAEESSSLGRISLRGYFRSPHLEKVKESIRRLSRHGVENIVLDFSEVPDVDNGVLEFIGQLSRNQELFPPSRVTIRNVQLIRNKILSIQGVQRLISQKHLPLKRVNRGDRLITPQDDSPAMYVVKTGSFAIFRERGDARIPLGRAEPGDVLGEMKLVAGGSRSATVEAEQSSQVYVIDVAEFYKNSYGIPNWFIGLIRSLVNRLRTTNDLLEQAVENQGRPQESPRQGVPESGDAAGSGTSGVSSPGSEPLPLGIFLDGNQPGKVILQGHFVEANLQYFSTLATLLIKQETRDITLDMKGVETLDRRCIKYLLKLYMYLMKKGGLLQILGPHQDILALFKQYDVELPEG